jgi:hypothetical protein
MYQRTVMSAAFVALVMFTMPTFGQTTTPELANFVPGKWMGPSDKAGVELDSVKDGVVTGRWLDITGITYPIGATWVKGKVASGRFEKGVFHLVTPPGNKMELTLSADGSSLSGTRQVVERGSYDPSQNQVTFKRK